MSRCWSLGYAVGLTVNIARDALDHRSQVQRARLRPGEHQLRSRPAGDDRRPSRRRCCCSSAPACSAWLRRALAAVGQMAVTNYLTHSPDLPDPVHPPRLVRPARAPPALLCRLRDLGRAAGRQPALAQAFPLRPGRMAVAQPHLCEAPADPASARQHEMRARCACSGCRSRDWRRRPLVPKARRDHIGRIYSYVRSQSRRQRGRGDPRLPREPRPYRGQQDARALHQRRLCHRDARSRGAAMRRGSAAAGCGPMPAARNSRC